MVEDFVSFVNLVVFADNAACLKFSADALGVLEVERKKVVDVVNVYRIVMTRRE